VSKDCGFITQPDDPTKTNIYDAALPPVNGQHLGFIEHVEQTTGDEQRLAAPDPQNTE